ncbi:protein WVD2-like 7 [Melia azedarach]|uniref:Protein WVD2-like 7 n=1 Tax=Melia azedarach TaxID=155640 RepID=A0ACC1Z0W1_MELAZ|nr:protein WVD2-like 7 [Melia azedarach]
MGESTCLMQVQPFSYAAGIPNESNEGNPVHALGQSISFGRFMSESLSWEKWSTFSHNKYVEEAERYSRPGSVAQKKAFFEAHYKEIAARKKAAALLEQAQDATNHVPDSQVEADNVTTQDPQMVSPNSQVSVAKQHAVNANEYDSNVIVDKSENNRVEGTDLVNENNVLVEKCVDVKSPKQLLHVKEMELSGTAQMENCVKVESSNQLEVVDKDLKHDGRNQKEKPQLKSSSSKQHDGVLMSKKKEALSSTKSSSYGRASKLPSTPAKPSKKENNATPISKKSALDAADKKRSTPKSIHKSIYLTPAREINRLTSTIIRKIDSSKAIGYSSKASKECSTPLRTPTVTSVSGVPKHPLATPWSENRRAGTPHESSTSTSKAVRAKWNFLPTENKLQSPNSFTPFRFRTEERAARRKEKLEERFNANQAQKIQEQATLKEKAETEMRKLRQTICFKARPLPDFYKERPTPKDQVKKDPLVRPESPKRARNSTPSTVQSKPFQPLQRPPTKNTGSNHVLEKKSHTSTHSLTSRPTKVTHENTSPNIQHE